MEFERLARSIFCPVHSSSSEKAKEWSREAGNRWSYSEHLVLWGPLLALVVVRRTSGGASCQEQGEHQRSLDSGILGALGLA